ncbi:hypothetical protein [Pedobacter metabolipauper]|nr:hypothetical protein [Pedobacter metabolipauper]
MLIQVPYQGSTPGTYNGTGYKWGIQFWGRNDIGTLDQSKTGGIYAVSEDGSAGFNRAVGLAFHTTSFDLTSTERLRITANGNVGIGLPTSNAKLTVYREIGLGATLNNTSLITSTGGLAGTSNQFFENKWLVRNAAGNDWTTISLHNGISVDASFANPRLDTKTWWERDPLKNIQSWGDNGDTYLTIKAGNVGIGTVTPLEKLSVNGKIRAHEIKVETANWPDYVFEKEYKITPLTELENYINDHKHLPEIPSAHEAELNGVDLGDMNKLLLKKVEELTLHLIEKDKDLKRQEKLNTSQEDRISKLEEALKFLLKK